MMGPQRQLVSGYTVKKALDPASHKSTQLSRQPARIQDGVYTVWNVRSV